MVRSKHSSLKAVPPAGEKIEFQSGGVSPAQDPKQPEGFCICACCQKEVSVAICVPVCKDCGKETHDSMVMLMEATNSLISIFYPGSRAVKPPVTH